MLPAGRAEDALQQTLRQRLGRAERGHRGAASCAAWLYRIAHNTAAAGLQRAGYDYDELHESLHGRERGG